MLRIKQIGTICFAISILISAPTFATGISSDASSAGCDNSTLNTYSGTSNLQAGWQANTIQLHWYSEDNEIQNVPSTSQSCTYDGSLTPPPVSYVPTRTGYTFKGWRARSCFASSVCGLTGSDVNGLVASGYGFKCDSTGQYGALAQNASTYGLTADNTWAVEFTDGIARGIAGCSSIRPSNYDTILAAMNDETMDEEQLMNVWWGNCNADTFISASTFSNSSPGQYCWCKMTSYTQSSGGVCNINNSSWVFYFDTDSLDGCKYGCAGECAELLSEFSIFRRALFGVQ